MNFVLKTQCKEEKESWDWEKPMKANKKWWKNIFTSDWTRKKFFEFRIYLAWKWRSKKTSIYSVSCLTILSCYWWCILKSSHTFDNRIFLSSWSNRYLYFIVLIRNISFFTTYLFLLLLFIFIVAFCVFDSRWHTRLCNFRILIIFWKVIGNAYRM